MKKSIFTKYFRMAFVIICIGFACLAAIQIFVSSRFWISEKERILMKNAQTVANSLSQSTKASPFDENRYTLQVDNGRDAPLIISSVANALEADILITDTRGVLITKTSHEKEGPSPTVTNDLITGKKNDPSLFEVSRLGNFYPERHYVACVAIERNDMRIGYVFLTSSTKSLVSYIWQNLLVYLLSAIAALVICGLAIYYFTYRITYPLQEMVNASKKISEGDFTTRVSVEGQDEIAELALSLNQMAESLGKVDSVSRSFISSVSHDLRTPMTTISGFVDSILDGTIPPEKESYYLNIVSEEVHRLSRLVQAMLNMSRIDNNTLQLYIQPFDLSSLLQKTLLTFEDRITQKDITISGLEDMEPCEIEADPDLIGQVLYNLIDNAVKFSNSGGEISFNISAADQKIRFIIRNTGEGVSSEEMPHVFDRFYKSDRSRSKDKTGSGLGLFIVKNVINLHHGEIVIRSVEHEYCELAFWLPQKH